MKNWFCSYAICIVDHEQIMEQTKKSNIDNEDRS